MVKENTIKKGYKQTEIGIIPEDWEVKTSVDLCIKIQDGTHFSPKLGGNDYLYITSKNIGHGYLDISNAERIDTSQHRKIYARCDVKNGDMLLTKDGANTGNAAINYLREEFSLLSSVAFLRFSYKHYDSRFFLQFILSNIGLLRIKELMSGNAITRLTLEKIKGFYFPVPPTLSEQTAIAEVLSDTDALIENLENQIAKKKAIKQGTMQQLLTGQKRLPGFGKKQGYKQTEIGVIPEDWDCLKITEVIIPSRGSIKIGPFGSALKKEYLIDNGFKVYGQENIYRKDMSIGDRFITSAYFRELKSCEIVSGDFLISMMGTVGQCMLVPERIAPGIMDSHLLRIKFDTSKINPYFITHLFETKIISNQIKQLSVGGIMEGLSSKIIKSIFIPVPRTKSEQTAIATVLSDMDSEIEVLEQKCAKYKQIKQGMMHQLLTGKIRLVNK
ncbi:MAG: restriction endonuclease subunit S [Candidatus Brocadiae bacterium]|nr:restriction endonuclease subunit S [Candidatus Brocadiia bacterium]